jgi:hypothetical protein
LTEFQACLILILGIATEKGWQSKELSAVSPSVLSECPRGIQSKDTLAKVNGGSLAAYDAWFCMRGKTQEERTSSSNHGLREE